MPIELPLAQLQRNSVSNLCIQRAQGCPRTGLLGDDGVNLRMSASGHFTSAQVITALSEIRKWLPFQDTSKTILLFASYEARKTISRFRALSRTSLFVASDEAAIFASDAPLASPREPTHGIRKRERDRAERVRLEGGPKPSLRERAVALVRKRGEVRTKDLTDIGIPRCYLSPMCNECLLVKVGHGRYRAAPQSRLKGRADRSG